MAKITIIPSSIQQIEKLVDLADAFIVGIDGLSVNMPIYFKLDDINKINEILTKEKKELFVSLNKNIHNKDLDYLKDTLQHLDNLNIKGILYYDISVLEFKKELNLKTDLVWAQEHFTTNMQTINYWYEKGVKYTYLSNEITLNSIKKIRSNTDSKLMLEVFGYVPMFNSERMLINNYKKNFNIIDDSKIYYIKKEGFSYPIIETTNGTEVYTYEPINSFNDINDLNNILDYIIFNSYLVPDAEFVNVLISYMNNKPLNKYSEDYFLHKESIYKVK